jgi:hypothetical protein
MGFMVLLHHPFSLTTVNIGKLEENAAEEFVLNLNDYVKANGFIPKQVLNCDKNGVFWGKKMPITQEAKA